MLPPRKESPGGAEPIVVRVAEYNLLAADGIPTEVFALISTLLDAPAGELAELYHVRWQIQNAFGALKSKLKGGRCPYCAPRPPTAASKSRGPCCAPTRPSAS
jgi:hypothetical protein